MRTRRPSDGVFGGTRGGLAMGRCGDGVLGDTEPPRSPESRGGSRGQGWEWAEGETQTPGPERKALPSPSEHSAKNSTNSPNPKQTGGQERQHHTTEHDVQGSWTHHGGPGNVPNLPPSPPAPPKCCQPGPFGSGASGDEAVGQFWPQRCRSSLGVGVGGQEGSAAPWQPRAGGSRAGGQGCPQMEQETSLRAWEAAGGCVRHGSAEFLGRHQHSYGRELKRPQKLRPSSRQLQGAQHPTAGASLALWGAGTRGLGD